jgi:hypothetical protein
MKAQHMNLKEKKAEANRSILGKRVLYELNIKQNPKQHVVTK